MTFFAKRYKLSTFAKLLFTCEWKTLSQYEIYK